MDHPRLRRFLEERDAKVEGHVAQRGQLVGAGAAGGEPPGLLVPEQLLAGQPADTLDVAALDLALVDERGEGVADVVQHVGAEHGVLTGEALDLDLGDRASKGEVVEGLADAGLLVEVDVRRAVVAGREERHALQVRLFGDLREAHGVGGAADRVDLAGLEDDVARRDAEVDAGDLREALADRAAGLAHRLAVEVAARRRGRRAGVRDLVGPRRHQADGVELHAEGVGGDLDHLGVETLAHLGAAVTDLHRAVLVEEHERAGLVEERGREGDAELHGRDREAALAVVVVRVEGFDLGPTRFQLRRLAELRPHRAEARRVVDRLPVVGAVAVAVEVALAHHVRRQAGRARDAIEDLFDHHHALRAAEAAEGRVRDDVGLADATHHAHRRHEVGVVEVKHAALEHRLGEIEAPAAVRVERAVDGEQVALVVETDLEAAEERVPLAGDHHVALAVEAKPHRAVRLPCAEGCDGREGVGVGLLAAEAAAHAQGLAGDLVLGHAEHARDDRLRLGGVLGRRVDHHLAGLVEVDEGALALEVELLLAADVELALQTTRRLRELLLHIAAFGCAVNREGAGVVALGRDGCLDAHDGRLLRDLEHHRRGGAPGERLGLREDPEHRLAIEAHDSVEHRLVEHRGPGVRLAGYVAFADRRDHTRHRERRAGVELRDGAVCDLRADRPRVEHVGEAREEVVGVDCAADVLGRALVGDRATDVAARGLHASGAHRATSAVCVGDESSKASFSTRLVTIALR